MAELKVLAPMYDYIIIGAGLYGAVFAYEATKQGKKCLVIERRKHVGGNIYCEEIEGIRVHQYGAHIFHTSDKRIWDYVNQFVSFNPFINRPIANYKGEIYNLPFNMNTFNRLWGVVTPEQAKKKIAFQREAAGITAPRNLEEQAISLVGIDIYNKLIKGYTEKQWGRKATLLPSFIINRLPVRFTYDNNYFDDVYQGIPSGGYNELIEHLLEDVEVQLNVDFFDCRDVITKMARKLVFTGRIDAYYNYCYGSLDYRSLRFEHSLLDIDNYQGNAVVNYTDEQTPYTRIIEHKHFEFGKQEKTVITKEYPMEWSLGAEPYYPINDKKNQERYRRYKDLADGDNHVIFGGRLGEYRYYDMHQVIKKALSDSHKYVFEAK